jgi:hypothetical protein
MAEKAVETFDHGFAVGDQVTINGTVTKVSEESVTIETPKRGPDVKVSAVSVHPSQVQKEGALQSDYVFQEYPKAIEPGVIATSPEHEAEIKAAPKKAADAAAKAQATKAAAEKAHK